MAEETALVASDKADETAELPASVAWDTKEEMREVAGAMTELNMESICGLGLGFARVKGRRTVMRAAVVRLLVRILME